MSKICHTTKTRGQKKKIEDVSFIHHVDTIATDVKL